MLGLIAALTLSAPTLRSLVSDVTSATIYRYDLKDADGRGMDCLEVSQPSGARDYVGVYHSMKSDVFGLYVAQSSDLLHWKSSVKIEDHASQGTLVEQDGRFLLAYEVDRSPGNFIRLRLYPSRSALEAGRHERQVDIPTVLSQLAEGTPSFVSTEIASGTIHLHFHYLSSTGVDRTSDGTLTNWTDWKAIPRSELNNSLMALGAGGNFGDRTPFTYAGRNYELQEVQLGKYDWFSWRIFLNDLDRKSVSPLSIRTHRGSKSFANPNIRFLTLPNGRPGMVETLFLPSQGSAPGEAGSLLFAKELN